MTETRIIDGKAFAATLRASIKERAVRLREEKGITPGLAVVLVGDDPASQVYVANKSKACVEAEMNSYDHRMPADISENDLLTQIQVLNNDANVHGILVQLPLPKHINENAIINAINPMKDVDGFHILNVGKLATGQKGFVPCTPLGCLMLLKEHVKEIAGKHAVVIGRSNIVGKPMARLLLQENCTVTIAHSKTKDLPEVIKSGDIVVAAVGQPRMIKGAWLKPGAIVIDVGINRLSEGGKTRLVGDVDFESCRGIASAITPVPGGVGSMTIACLLENTLNAAKLTNT